MKGAATAETVRVRSYRSCYMVFRYFSFLERLGPVLAQVRIFGNLIEDLPARAARENFGKSALAQGPDRH